MSQLEVGTKSHVGRSRKINQDSLAALDSPQVDRLADGLFVVADGMGGRAGGEVASQVTVQTVCKVVREALADHSRQPTNEALAEALSEAVSAANHAVWNQSRANPELRGMGTTCVSALIRGNVAAVGNVGDSRAYLLRHGEMSQITSDHSLVHEYVLAGDLTPEEARSSRYKNVITRAIGIANEVTPDVELLNLVEGDTLLLCSDGLTNMLSDTEIATILASSPTADDACDELIDAANGHGGIDNITTIVVRYGEFSPHKLANIPILPRSEPEAAPAARHGNKPGSRWILTTLIAVVLCGGTAGGVYVINGSWPVVTVRWKSEPYKPPPAPPPPKQFDYAPPQYVFNRPILGSPLACDPKGAIIVRSTNGKLIRLSPKGDVLGDYGAPISTTESGSDVHMKIDSLGNMYLSLRQKKVIHKYDSSGKRRAVIGAGKLLDPEDIAINSYGDVYVVDAGRLKVCKIREVKESPAGTGPHANPAQTGSANAGHGGNTGAP